MCGQYYVIVFGLDRGWLSQHFRLLNKQNASTARPLYECYRDARSLWDTINSHGHMAKISVIKEMKLSNLAPSRGGGGGRGVGFTTVARYENPVSGGHKQLTIRIRLSRCRAAKIRHDKPQKSGEIIN